MPILVPMTICWPATSNGAPISSIRRLAEACRLGRLLDARLHDGEFVAAEARHRVRFTQLPDQPFGHGPQQLVTDRMAQRVVHRFELVEVKEQQREAATLPRVRKRMLELLTEQHAVGQVGERVVMREMNHFRFRRALVGDFLERGKPPLLHRLVGHLERTAIAGFPGRGRPLIALHQFGATLAHILHVLGADLPCRNDGIGDLTIFHARRQSTVGNPEHPAKAVVDDQKLASLIEHQQALQHVVQSGVKALALPLQSEGTTLALLGCLQQRMAT